MDHCLDVALCQNIAVHTVESISLIGLLIFSNFYVESGRERERYLQRPCMQHLFNTFCIKLVSKRLSCGTNIQKQVAKVTGLSPVMTT